MSGPDAPQDSSQRVTFPSEAARPPPPSPPSAFRGPSRRRERGYSLRRQLFFRNTGGQQQQHSLPQTSAAQIATTVSNDSVELHGLIKSTSPVSLKQSQASGSESLIRSHEWQQKNPDAPKLGSKLLEFAKELKKTILRQHELPPTKDGRKIPLDASRNEHLLDERTGYPYINNTIRSSRYTVWNFLPKQLFAQFSKLANFYFLCVSILQMIPTLSTTGTYTTIVPLIFFISLSIFKEGYDDYRRYKMDKKENNREAKLLDPEGPKACGEDADEDEDEDERHWKTSKWIDVRVGDIVRLERDDWVPADLLMLHSDGENGVAYIETMALDGETNLKNKQALPIIAEQCDTMEGLRSFRAEVVVEDPNPDLYNFEGKVIVGEETRPLTNNQIIYRGSILRNTPSMAGMVIFSGEETKIRMNANKNPRTKAPALQVLVNRIVIIVVIFVIFLAVFNSVAYQIWRRNRERKSWYLTDSTVAFFPIFASYVIMFNTLIPLSLYVVLEIIKVAQMLLMNDIDMYHEESDTPFEAHTSTINEDCGQVSYIFSDKTGTLTDNSMQFRKLSVAGHAWLHDQDMETDTEPKLKHKKRKAKEKSKNSKRKKKTLAHHRYGNPAEDVSRGGRKSMGDMASPRPPPPAHVHSMDIVRKTSTNSLRRKSMAGRPQSHFSTAELMEYIRTHPHTFFARKARLFLLSIAVCHTCLPEVDEEDGSIDYQAASPDELALVRAAQELGYIAINRQYNTLSIKTFPNGLDADPVVETYEILEVIEFSSKRKRMSVVVRLPNGKICIFCKGADTTIIDLLRLRDLAKSKASDIERKVEARKSIEAQEMIRRTSMHRPSIGGGRPSFVGGRPSFVGGRPSFAGGRTSLAGGRPSLNGPSRASATLSRFKSTKARLDEWLREKEKAVDAPLVDDDDSLFSRPSAQYESRHSIAFGETPRPDLDMDSEFVDEDLALDDARIFERCFAHVNHFATEGLRTLLYAHRYIEEHEYETWKRIYADATTSLVDRTAMIERAADMIERDFDLTGATAIEDKLQKGVPEAIDKLQRAGIKIWMLTGDKRETAINIGHSCRLIRDYSTVVILHSDDPTIASTMRNAIHNINAQKVAHSVVVVDGGTLTFIENDEHLKSLFFEIAVLTESVICCRASPAQKALLVKTIRTKVQKSVTLAIGDGANDIAMIQEAHVGVGITGKEGLQAARVSDYSMAQFRFLLKFLLVHGRWNYVRTTKYTLCTFWKEMLFYLTQAMFQRWNGYTGSSLYEPWSLSMFNTLFTSLPVFVVGVFEKDLAASTLLAVPELYNYGQLNRGFSFKIYLGWMFVATTQAMLAYFMMFALYTPRTMVDQSVYAMGSLTYTVCVIVISCKMQLIEMHNKSIMVAISFFLSVGGWFLWNIILSSVYGNNIIHNVKGSFLNHFGRDLSWWLTVAYSIAACLIFDLSIIVIRATFWPSDVDTFQEIEQDLELRKRLEEAASSELQAGWNRGKDKEKEMPEVRRESERDIEMDEDMEAIVARRFGSVKVK